MSTASRVLLFAGFCLGVWLSVAVPSACAATYVAKENAGVAWLLQQQNNADGSWGASDDVKYVQTSESVLALAALNQLGSAYFNGLVWLNNHSPANVDFTARRVLASGKTGASVSLDLQTLQSAQDVVAYGNNGWGLSGAYQGSPLDTALSLQALTQQSVATNVSVAVSFLTASQLAGTDTGWALGQETTSDPITTSQVLLSLIPLESQGAAVVTAVANGLTALNLKVTTASPVPQIALAALANVRNSATSPQAATLFNALTSRQAPDGSWGEDAYATALALRALAASSGTSTQQQTADVTDPNLRAAINNALGHNALDALNMGEMAALTTLTASNQGIASLAGLQYATHLTYIDLRNNNISSFSQIAGLPNTATVLETGNPGDPGTQVATDNDVPTLPQWGMIIMAALLLLVMLRQQRNR